jgi:hypothetical protein
MRGTRDLLATLSGVQALGISRRSSAVLWDASAPWETTTAGLAELVSTAVGLDDEETTRLLRALERMRASGQWPRPRAASSPAPRPAEAPESQSDPIESIDDFLERLQKSGRWYDERLRRYARDDVAAADVPALLETVRDNRWQHRGYGSLRMVVSLLARHGLHDAETEQVFRELLSVEPGTVPASRPLSHVHPKEISELAARALDPYFEDPWYVEHNAWMGAREAEVAFRLLLPHAERVDPPEDACDRDFRRAVNRALGAVASASTDLAEDIVPLLANRVADTSLARLDAVCGLGEAARHAPAAAVAALPSLNGLLEHPDPAVRASAVEAIGYAAAVDDGKAQIAARTCLELLSQRGEVPQSAGLALGHLVAGNTPQTTKQIVRKMLRLMEAASPALEEPVSNAMTIVVQTIRDRQSPGVE